MPSIDWLDYLSQMNLNSSYTTMSLIEFSDRATARANTNFSKTSEQTKMEMFPVGSVP